MADTAPVSEGRTFAPKSLQSLLAPVIVVGLALVVFHQRYLTFLASNQEFVGTDYSYFLPHMLAGDYWFARNGPFAVPWMTPAFCGGLPLYPNPQSFYYSPAQWLSFVVDPLTAVRWAIMLYAAAGGFGAYVLLRRSFGASVPASLLAAIVFLFNGFFSHRMLIGHFGFASFMLVPLVATLIIGGRSPERWLARGLGAGILMAAMFQAGFVVLMGPSGMAVLFLAILATIRTGHGTSMLKATGVALVTAGALSAAKFVAALGFLSQFNRDYYPLPGVESVSDLVSVVTRMLFDRVESSTDRLFKHGKIRMGLHEWEYSLSPVPLMVMVLGLFFLVANRFRQRGSRSDQPFDMRIGLLVVLLLVPLALNFYTKSWNNFLFHLPVIGSMQTLTRWFSFYIPVAVVGAGLSADLIPLAGRGPVVFVGILGVIAFHLSEPLVAGAHLPGRRFMATEVQDAWRTLHNAGEVKSISVLDVLRSPEGRIDTINGENALAHGASSLVCYEPLFGYDLRKFPVQSLHDGPSMDVTDGDLNIKNPACFIYPKENSCRGGAHLPADRKAEAEAFLDYRPLAWQVSGLQRVANVVNVLALVAAPLLLAWAFLRSRKES